MCSVGVHAGLETLGPSVSRAEPSQQIPLADHDQQAEAFYVLEEVLHGETPAEAFAVPAGQLFVVEPGNLHRAFNPADAGGAVEVIAMGAPSIADVHEYEG